MTEAKARIEIKVTVTFPLAQGPYHGNFDPETTVGAVRTAAMSEMGVEGDGQYSYYLIHKEDPQNDQTTLGALVGRARAMKFALVKELTQG